MNRLKNDMLERIRKVYNYKTDPGATAEWRYAYSIYLNNEYLFDETNKEIIKKELENTLNYCNRLS